LDYPVIFLNPIKGGSRGVISVRFAKIGSTDWTLAFFEKVKLFGNRTRISRINTDSFEKIYKNPCESVSNLKFARLQY
jgi:hypothetical protein